MISYKIYENIAHFIKGLTYGVTVYNVSRHALTLSWAPGGLFPSQPGLELETMVQRMAGHTNVSWSFTISPVEFAVAVPLWFPCLPPLGSSPLMYQL